MVLCGDGASAVCNPVVFAGLPEIVHPHRHGPAGRIRVLRRVNEIPA